MPSTPGRGQISSARMPEAFFLRLKRLSLKTPDRLGKRIPEHNRFTAASLQSLVFNQWPCFAMATRLRGSLITRPIRWQYPSPKPKASVCERQWHGTGQPLSGCALLFAPESDELLDAPARPICAWSLRHSSRTPGTASVSPSNDIPARRATRNAIRRCPICALATARKLSKLGAPGRRSAQRHARWWSRGARVRFHQPPVYCRADQKTLVGSRCAGSAISWAEGAARALEAPRHRAPHHLPPFAPLRKSEDGAARPYLPLVTFVKQRMRGLAHNVSCGNLKMIT